MAPRPRHVYGCHNRGNEPMALQGGRVVHGNRIRTPWAWLKTDHDKGRERAEDTHGKNRACSPSIDSLDRLNHPIRRETRRARQRREERKSMLLEDHAVPFVLPIGCSLKRTVSGGWLLEIILSSPNSGSYWAHWNTHWSKEQLRNRLRDLWKWQGPNDNCKEEKDERERERARDELVRVGHHHWVWCH